MIAEHSEAAWKVGGGLCQLKRLEKSKWRHWEGGMLKITTLVAARRPIRRGAENYFLYRWPWTRTWESDWLEGFPGGSDGKAPARNAGDPGSISGSGRSPGEGNGNPLQYSCLENPALGSSSFGILSFCLFIMFMGFSRLSCFKYWKMMLWKCYIQYASKFGKLNRTGKNSTGLETVSFHSNSKKKMPKNAQTTTQLHSSHMLVK